MDGKQRGSSHDERRGSIGPSCLSGVAQEGHGPAAMGEVHGGHRDGGGADCGHGETMYTGMRYCNEVGGIYGPVRGATNVRLRFGLRCATSGPCAQRHMYYVITVPVSRNSCLIAHLAWAFQNRHFDVKTRHLSLMKTSFGL